MGTKICVYGYLRRAGIGIWHRYSGELCVLPSLCLKLDDEQGKTFSAAIPLHRMSLCQGQRRRKTYKYPVRIGGTK